MTFGDLNDTPTGKHNIKNSEELWPWEHDAVDPFRHYRGPKPEGE